VALILFQGAPLGNGARGSDIIFGPRWQAATVRGGQTRTYLCVFIKRFGRVNLPLAFRFQTGVLHPERRGAQERRRIRGSVRSTRPPGFLWRAFISACIAVRWNGSWPPHEIARREDAFPEESDEPMVPASPGARGRVYGLAGHALSESGPGWHKQICPQDLTDAIGVLRLACL